MEVIRMDIPKSASISNSRKRKATELSVNIKKSTLLP